MRTRRYAMAIVVLLAVVSGIWVATHRSSAPTPFDITGLPAELGVRFDDFASGPRPSRPRLGLANALEVSGLDPTNADQQRISILHTAGAVNYRDESWVDVHDGRARLPLATSAMSEAGTHHVIVFTDRQRGEFTFTLDAGPAQAGFVPIVGPSRITADGTTKVVVSVSAADAFGNGAGDGTPVEVRVRRPTGTIDVYQGTVSALVAGIDVPSTTDVGINAVLVSVDGVVSEPVEFTQVAGPPASMKLAVESPAILADGRSTIAVTADAIHDASGNPVADGTALRAIVNTPAGRAIVQTVAVQGAATFVVRAPTRPGPMTVTIDGAAPLALDATPAVTSITATLDRSTRTVIVGPVTSPLDGFVADGSRVSLQRDGTDIAVAQIIDGYATLSAPTSANLDGSDRLSVEILGVTETVEVPK